MMIGNDKMIAKPQLTVNLAAVRHNYLTLRNIHKFGRTGAVVKANAYGLSVEKIIPILRHEGCRDFFIAQPQEYDAVAPFLKDDMQLYILNGASLLTPEMLQNPHVIPVINNMEELSQMPSLDHSCVHIDTGMNRFGISQDQLSEVPQIPFMAMSHFSCADEPDHQATKIQIEVFQKIIDSYRPQIASLANSGGLLYHPMSHHDLSRPGIALYGGIPHNQLKNVISLHAPIMQKRTLNRGDTVGYGASYVAQRRQNAYVLPVGYADGLPRSLSHQTYRTSDNIAISFLGRISMDSCVVGLDPDPLVTPNYISLIKTSQDLISLAQAAGTISYEILTAIGNQFRGSKSWVEDASYHG